MDRPHDSDSSTRAATPASASDSDTAALSELSTTGKGGRSSRFSFRNAGSILFKTVPDRFHSPESIANQIRRLCRHDETTICQRHMVSAKHVQDADKETIKSLCKKLLSFCCGLSLLEQLDARTEMTDLSINDCFVRATFQQCGIDDATVRDDIRYIATEKPYLVSLIDNSVKVGKDHDRWSELLANRGLVIRDGESAEMCRTALKKTFSTIPYWAPKYLTHALALDFKGRDLEALLEFWECCLNCFTKDQPYRKESKNHPFYWNSADDFASCVKSILSSGKSLSDFLSPTHLAAKGFAQYLVQWSFRCSVVFTTFFAVPTIRFHRVGKVVSGVEFTYPPVSGWNLSHASSYSCPFLLSAGQDIGDRLSVSFTGFETVFENDTWITLYRVAEYALAIYPRGRGFSIRYGLTESTRGDLNFLARMSVQLLRKSSRVSSKDEALAAFYIAQSFDIDRYCKNAVHQALHNDTVAINMLDVRSRSLNSIKMVNGLYNLTYIRLFENVPYLRRYKINGHYIITSDYLPEPPNTAVKSGCERMPDDLTVDTMRLDGHTIVCLRVTNLNVRSLDLEVISKFDCTGHYPILAGYDPTDEPLYVAAVRLGFLWHFTTVKNGAFNAVYSNEVGDIRAAEEFFVLALRHDPSDFPPPYPRARKGAMDPTGPVSWLRFWPEKDPEYFEDARLVNHDRLLESFLNGFAAQRDSERCILSGFD